MSNNLSIYLFIKHKSSIKLICYYCLIEIIYLVFYYKLITLSSFIKHKMYSGLDIKPKNTTIVS